MNKNFKQFCELCSTDIWLLEKMLALPRDENPSVVIDEGLIKVEVYDTFSLKDQQEAVIKYRSSVIPAIFVFAQKVYGELFHLVLINNKNKKKSKQEYIEKCIKNRMDKLTKLYPFNSKEEMIDWFKGSYDFETLRLARNKVVHNKYEMKNGLLYVKVRTENLAWTEDEVLNFANSVITKAKKCLMKQN
ncbi:hypothetical protein [Alkalihalophilus marmarensis]|uniref:Uncharacterized protein n=1 Tax=Alkalihalophilus marmarensis DSM 21297 TaxID=1188261 RepID=U6SJS2_9BACI|nr:hypothetical protein [Alkalihalophilus marmarensis]ERN51964.1 hypothetical protein A33I_17890 [Alkalihalophilus marmarensis DSM 21297]